MKNDFKSVLQHYATDVVLGDHEEKLLPIDSLRTELNALRKVHQRTFYIILASIIIVFLGTLIVTLLYSDNPQTVAALFTATGVGVAWSISQMRQLWKEQVAIELTLALLAEMRPAAFKSVLEILLTRF